MASRIKQEKLPNILENIKQCIQSGNYRLTGHALLRQKERVITLPEILYILKNGYEEKRKTTFDVERNTRKYAIRGKTLRDQDIRVIEMLIITVLYV